MRPGAVDAAGGDGHAATTASGRAPSPQRDEDAERLAAALSASRGPEPFRNRYELHGAGSLAVAAHRYVRMRLRQPAIRLGRALLESIVFSTAPPGLGTSLRAIARRVFRTDLARIAPHFDAGLYGRQFRHARRRVRAATDPLLHYRLIGWRERRTPNAGFDPIFYARQVPGLGFTREPFLHFLHEGRAAGLVAAPARHSLGETAAPAGPVLVFTHGRGGGAAHYLDLMQERIAGDRPVVRLRPLSGAPWLVAWDSEAGLRIFDLAAGEGWSALEAAARSARVAGLLVNHLIDQEPAALPAVARLARALGVPFDVILHDYYLVCPRVDGVTGRGHFCSIAPAAACGACVGAYGSELGRVDVGEWRRLAGTLLRQARRVIVPSGDLAGRLAPHLGGITFDIQPPEADDGYPPQAVPALGAAEPLRLATLGGLNVPKGASVVLDLAVELARRAEPVALTVIGPSALEGPLVRQGVTVTGRYRPDELAGLIAAHAPHAVLLPAIWPETWSFVLTEALRSGLPVIAFDIGAPAARLRRLDRGRILPLELAYAPADLAQALADIRRQWLRP